MRNLQKIPEDQLAKQINATKAYVDRQNKKGIDSKDAETELCYLEREMEHRTKTKKLHEEYIKSIEQQKREFELLMKEEEEALREEEDQERRDDEREGEY